MISPKTRSAKWYKKNKKRLSRKRKANRKKNGNKIRAYHRTWYAKNKKKQQAYRKKRLKKLGNKIRAYHRKYGKKWRRKNRGKIREKDRLYKRQKRKNPKFRKKENDLTSRHYHKMAKSPKFRKRRNRTTRKWARENPEGKKRSGALYYIQVRKPKLKAAKAKLDAAAKSNPKLKQKIERQKKRIRKRDLKRKLRLKHQQKKEAMTMCSLTEKLECSKPGCKVNDLAMLGIHHRYGRKRFPYFDAYSQDLYRRVISHVEKNEELPPGLQTMCHNQHQKLECNKRRRDKKKDRLPKARKQLVLRHAQKKQALIICSHKDKLECSKPDCKVNDMDILTLHHRSGRKKYYQKDMEAEQMFRDVIKAFDKNRKVPFELETLCHNHHQKRESQKQVVILMDTKYDAKRKHRM